MSLTKWENEREMNLKELDWTLEYQVLPFFRNILQVVQAVGAENGSSLINVLDKYLDFEAWSREISWNIKSFGSTFKRYGIINKARVKYRIVYMLQVE